MILLVAESAAGELRLGRPAPGLGAALLLAGNLPLDERSDLLLAAARLRRRGLVPERAEGPVAFLARAAAACPDLAAELREIRRHYVALRYGPRPREEDLARLKFLVNALRP